MKEELDINIVLLRSKMDLNDNIIIKKLRKFVWRE